MSISNFAESTIMDALFNNTSAAALQLTNRYVKLHTADPGEAGTTAAAGETTRKSLDLRRDHQRACSPPRTT